MSYITAYLFSRPPVSGNNWRWMLGLAALPAVVQWLGMSFMPESPRFLVQKGKKKEALDVLISVRPPTCTREDLEEEIELIHDRLMKTSEEDVSLSDLFKAEGYRNAMIVAIGLQSLQQLSG